MRRWLIWGIWVFFGTQSLAHSEGLKGFPLARPIQFGSALMGEPLRLEADYRRLFLENFNLLTPENELQFWFLRPEKDKFVFGPAEKMLAFAKQNGVPVRGHFLVPDVHIPDWLEHGSWTAAELEKILVEHIETVVGHFRDQFPGQIIYWDVANELFTTFGSLKANLFWSRIGREPLDFVRLAYRTAHRADPQAKLFYNDVRNENFNLKSGSILRMLRQLRREGVPIHGVGIQAHLWGPIDRRAVAENMRHFAESGFEVQITEMDLRVGQGVPLNERTYGLQAKIYGDLLSTCLEASNCTVFSVWGFTERHTWIPDRMGPEEKDSRPSLLFDRDLQPRPAYHELLSLLRQNSTKP